MSEIQMVPNVDPVFSLQAMCRSFGASDYCMYVCRYVCMYGMHAMYVMYVM